MKKKVFGKVMGHPIQYTKLSAVKKLSDQLKDFDIETCPFDTFKNWYSKASKFEENPDQMSVATVDQFGFVRNRFLLFKGIVDSNFIFYTNYLSQKGQDLEKNHAISLNFFWSKLGYQVRVSGFAKKTSKEFSNNYFQSRDRDSQLASYLSKQSSPISSREEILLNLEILNKQFQNREIPCPENWGGYAVLPEEFEFFIYGQHRINDRFSFKENAGEWELSRLQP